MPLALVDYFRGRSHNNEIILLRRSRSGARIHRTFRHRRQHPNRQVADAGEQQRHDPGMGQGGVALTFYESVE